MRKLILVATAALLTMDPGLALAKQKTCSPGLAKKNNGCLPPGQAKKIYGTGDYIDGDYVVIRRPDRYGLDPDQTYYRVGDYIYRVDRDTRQVLDLIGAIGRILN